MYVPTAFTVDDPAALHAVMTENPFATLVTANADEPFATHLPLRHFPAEDGPGTLVGHVARANPQWRQFQPDRDVLAIFHGPHAYVSPTWYETKLAVPTWNYVAVHAYGRVRRVEDAAEIRSQLRDLTAYFENSLPQPWAPDLPDDYWDRMTQAIVLFEISLTRVEGKFKLSQNKSTTDIQGVIAALATSIRPMDREVAARMQAAAPG